MLQHRISEGGHAFAISVLNHMQLLIIENDKVIQLMPFSSRPIFHLCGELIQGNLFIP